MVFSVLVAVSISGFRPEVHHDMTGAIEEVVFTTRSMGPDGHWYANFGYYAFDENAKLYTEGSTLCKLNMRTGDLQVLFHDDKGSFRDPQLHYDGKRMLFSFRKGDSEHFHIYETDTKGSFLRQVTDGPYSDIEPTYLPDGDILFVSTRRNCWVNCWSTQVATMYRCKSDGSGITQLSANIEHDNTPWVLPNGQIMYTRWEYVDRSQVHFHHLWVMNPDGTRQTTLFGNQTSSFKDPNSCLLIDAKPVPWSQDTVIATYSPGHGRREHAGYPVLIGLNNGPDDKNAYRFLTDKKIHYYDPYAIDSDRYIASTGTELTMFNRQGVVSYSFSLPDDFVEQQQMIFEPRPVTSRVREPVVASALKEETPYGLVVLQDVYRGRNMNEIESGSISHLLILETLRKPVNFTGGNEPMSYTGSFTLERIVGKVPVEQDGSAYFKLPADRPYLFVALDDRERAVQKMKSFTSVRPGEVVSCIGCHERRSTAPDNRGYMPLALSDEPEFPQQITGIPQLMDFTRDIQPILDRHCVSCHNPEKREGGVLMTGDRGPVYSHSYFNLMARFQVNDGLNHPYPLNKPGIVGDMHSLLIRKIEEGHGDVSMTNDEIRTIRYWINTGALYPGTYGALGTGMIGTMTNNQPDMRAVENKAWDKATEVINAQCRSCHQALRPHIVDEQNLTWWRSRVEVTSGQRKIEDYEQAIRFSRHILYNLTHPEKSAILLAPLSTGAGGYGSCTAPDGTAVFETTQDHGYRAILTAVQHTTAYLDSIKRFDMDGFAVRPEYYREMVRFGVLNEGIPIGAVDPYVTDSLYWLQQ
jgi:hypothetical protein